MKKTTLGLALALAIAIANIAPAAMQTQQEDWRGLSLKAMELVALGKSDEANDAGKQALEAAEKTLGPGHPAVAALCYQLAELKRSRADNAEAEQLYKKSLAILERAGENEMILTAYPLVGLGNVNLDRGKVPEAVDLYKTALKSLEEHGSGSTTKLTLEVASRLEKLYRAVGNEAMADSMKNKQRSLDKNMVVSKGPIFAQANPGAIIGSIFNGIGNIITRVTPVGGFPPIGIAMDTEPDFDMDSDSDMDSDVGVEDDSSMGGDVPADPQDPDSGGASAPWNTDQQGYAAPPKPQFGISKFDEALKQKLANKTMSRTEPQKGKRADDQIALGNKFRNLGKSNREAGAVKPVDQGPSPDPARETANPMHGLAKQLKTDIETGNSEKVAGHFGNLSNVNLGQVFDALTERDVDQLMAVLSDADRNKLLRRLNGANLDKALASVLHPETSANADFQKEVFSGLDDYTLRKITPHLRPNDFAVLAAQGFGVDRFLKAGVSMGTLLDLGVEIPAESRRQVGNDSGELTIVPADQQSGRDQIGRGTRTGITTDEARRQTARPSTGAGQVEAWNKLKNSPDFKQFVDAMSRLDRQEPGRSAN
ncbi:MAG: tetratricopeptide repeat protein [Pseudomonadota bacterium]